MYTIFQIKYPVIEFLKGKICSLKISFSYKREKAGFEGFIHLPYIMQPSGG